MAIEFKNDSSEEQERIVTSTLISEDEAEVSLRPRTLSEYIGQEKAKENLEVFISAARQRGDKAGGAGRHRQPRKGRQS